MILNLQLHTGCQRLWRPHAPASEVQDSAALPSQSAIFRTLWRKLSVVHVFPHRHFLLCTVDFSGKKNWQGRGQEGGCHLQPLEIFRFSVNHLEFPRQKEATTFCLLFLEFLFFSEQLIKDLRTTARKPLHLQSPQLCSQCAGCQGHRGQRHKKQRAHGQWRLH